MASGVEGAGDRANSFCALIRDPGLGRLDRTSENFTRVFGREPDVSADPRENGVGILYIGEFGLESKLPYQCDL
jgi:hypothetical protein